MGENIDGREAPPLAVIVSIDPPEASRHNALVFIEGKVYDKRIGQ
jgi:hypothetical protein